MACRIARAAGSFMLRSDFDAFSARKFACAYRTLSFCGRAIISQQDSGDLRVTEYGGRLGFVCRVLFVVRSSN